MKPFTRTAFLILCLMALVVKSLDLPSKDDFYDTPSRGDLEKTPGTVLKSRELPGTVRFYNMTEPDGDPINVNPYKKAVQLKFVSTNSKGERVGAVANVLIPYNSKVDKVVSFADANVYSNKDCAVSYTMQKNGADSDIAAILQRGWTIVQPDSKGLDAALGTNIRGGNIILDSLKAAVSHKAVGVEDNARIALWSSSFGSTAVAWAAQSQPKYAPDLNLVGVAIGSTLVNISEVLLNVNDGPLSYLIPPTLVGLAKEYPEIDKYFQPEEDKEFFSTAKEDCTGDLVLQYSDEDIFSELSDGKEVFSNSAVAKIMNNMTLGSSAPKVPMLVFHGTEDEVAPIESAESTIKKYCEKGTPSLQYYRIQGANHSAAGIEAYNLAMSWISDRLDGKTPSDGENKCNTKAHTTSIDSSSAIKVTLASETPTPSATSTANNEDTSSENDNAGSFFTPASFFTSAILLVFTSSMLF
ncbi:hypothetical protein TRICI_005848 [Trichomonascus ciferrii]|uniref:Triacylglycerol lipase n=1 Tax=Trichomonascus ciferrii TaxID=44093 RepID=A0A642UQQ4_9ASCO|nr:hypothetical protein TRICI_005848 [Trichomonascus ciferrii]